jgi:zinc protease
MSKNQKKTSKGSFTEQKAVGPIKRFVHSKNGLSVLYVHKPNTGVVTSHLVYKAGSRDEAVGETGVAHMLEHMLFKPTVNNKAKKQESAAMRFEKETGAILNANTWRDRTTYFFSYPKEHFATALKIEAERMRGLIIEDKEFLPERNNVLSEFDMVNGDPYFALSVAMHTAAFQNHPYRHEVIGFREDIEAYTTDTLKRFYDRFYWPNNATCIVVGDITADEALSTIDAQFGSIPHSPTPLVRSELRDPVQQGIRRTAVNRPSPTSIFAIGGKHPGVTDRGFYRAVILAKLLTDGPDSILERRLVDTGIATNVGHGIEPSKDTNLMTLFVTLAPNNKKPIEPLVRSIINELDAKTVKPYLQKIKAHLITDEYFSRASSLGLADELVEYVSADLVEEFYDTPSIIDSVTPQQVVDMAKQIFAPHNITIGTFNYEN